MHSQKDLDKEFSQNYEKLMLFKRDDLKSTETFNLARKRIIEEQLLDKITLLELNNGKNINSAIYNASDTISFLENYEATDSLRKKILNLKDSTIKSQTWFEGLTWGLLPFVIRVFRKYALGLNRFAGSVNYLSDKEADKLGNERDFSFKQIIGTALSSLSSPMLISYFLDKAKSSTIKAGSFMDKIKSQLDMKHGFYPKLGLFIFQGELPFLISKIFNAQDGFELTEILIKSTVANLSTFFGDRFTNGNLAKRADKELATKFNEEEGILYYKDNTASKSRIASILPPEAAKFSDVINKTRHNPALKESATDLYQKIFYQGFGLHALSMFCLRVMINWTTKLRVSNALGINKI
jgi:hypothetical protein